MNVKFVYKKRTCGGGFMTSIPRVGDFIKINSEICKVESVLFEIIGTNATAIIYLVDIMAETESKLRYF